MGVQPITLVPVTSLPVIQPGDELAGLILAALAREKIALANGDVLVVAQKIVSKAEGRARRLADIEPSERALELAATVSKDARLVELILQESNRLVRSSDNLLIVEHRLGHVMANAGIDQSNVSENSVEDGSVLLLPEDPDRSARQLRDALQAATGKRIGIVITDSFGRPFRMGTVGVAIGIAGPAGLVDRRGEPDLFGRRLEVTEVAQGDAIAAAAVLVMGEGNESCPAVVMRGFDWQDSGQGAGDLLRPPGRDLFR